VRQALEESIDSVGSGVTTSTIRRAGAKHSPLRRQHIIWPRDIDVASLGPFAIHGLAYRQRGRPTYELDELTGPLAAEMLDHDQGQVGTGA